FFSSRGRHTRLSRDWSSDVCSSDLSPGPLAAAAIIPPRAAPGPGTARAAAPHRPAPDRPQRLLRTVGDGGDDLAQEPPAADGRRSEERRVGKEGRPNMST